MTIDDAAKAFDQAADAYERGRPSYPAAAVAWMADRLPLGPGRTVVDLAAGTGKFTRLLGPLGGRVIAVEPVEGMRTTLTAAVAGIEVLDGTAEAMPLDDGSVDAVTAAQAFHWFDGPRALAEIHRVLRDGGGLGLIWNKRDMSDPLQYGLNEIIHHYRGGAPSFSTGRWRAAFEDTELFTPLESTETPWIHELDEESAVDRALSTSVIAGLADDERGRVERAVRHELAAVPRPIQMRYITQVFVCSKRS